MSPLAATSALSSVAIKVDWTDDEILLFLASRRNGDPLPSNVITDVNPFSFDPWNGPDNFWYLCNSKESISPKGQSKIERMISGYWKDMRCDHKIFSSTSSVGRKIMWEFFGGEGPGDNLRWIMFEYKLEKTEFQATDKMQDLNSMCRVFCCNKNTTDFEGPQNTVGVGDADGEYIQSVHLGMLDQEEENKDLLESTAYGPQGTMAVHDRNLEDLRSIESAELHAACDFSIGDFLELKDLCDPEFSSSSSDNSSCASGSDFSVGDFLELKDLCDPEFSSSSSDNSSCASGISDEYFDTEALLRDLENEDKLTVEGCHTEHKFRVSTSQANHVVVQPPSQGSLLITGGNLVITEAVSAASASGRGPQPVRSLSVPPLSRNGGASRDYQDNKEVGSSSQHAGTSQGSVTNRVGRIARLGKKYFCFASY